MSRDVLKMVNMVQGQQDSPLIERCILQLVPGKTYQHPVIDEFLCIVAGCALGTDVCHWMFL